MSYVTTGIQTIKDTIKLSKTISITNKRERTYLLHRSRFQVQPRRSRLVI